MNRSEKILERLARDPGNYDGTSGLFAFMTPTDPLKLIIEFSKFSSFIPMSTLDDIHVTVMYSKDALNQEFTDPILDSVEATPLHLEYWAGHDAEGYLVLKVLCDPLVMMNTRFRELGASPPTYNEYNPHITLAKGFDLNSSIEDLIEQYNKVMSTKSTIALSNFKMNNVS